MWTVLLLTFSVWLCIKKAFICFISLNSNSTSPRTPESLLQIWNPTKSSKSALTIEWQKLGTSTTPIFSSLTCVSGKRKPPIFMRMHRECELTRLSDQLCRPAAKSTFCSIIPAVFRMQRTKFMHKTNVSSIKQEKSCMLLILSLVRILKHSGGQFCCKWNPI